jgi:hypothetical protein
MDLVGAVVGAAGVDQRCRTDRQPDRRRQPLCASGRCILARSVGHRRIWLGCCGGRWRKLCGVSTGPCPAADASGGRPGRSGHEHRRDQPAALWPDSVLSLAHLDAIGACPARTRLGSVGFCPRHALVARPAMERWRLVLCPHRGSLLSAARHPRGVGAGPRLADRSLVGRGHALTAIHTDCGDLPAGCPVAVQRGVGKQTPALGHAGWLCPAAAPGRGRLSLVQCRALWLAL